MGLGAKPWRWAPLVTPERVLNEYNEDLILIFLSKLRHNYAEFNDLYITSVFFL